MSRIPQIELERRAAWRGTCGICGSSFGWSKNLRDRKRYCSQVCSGRANGRIATFRGKLNHYVCLYCCKPFDSYYKNRVYCSRECTVLHRRELPVPRGYACRVDANHAEISRALKDAGASVLDCSKVGQGCPDLIVGKNGKTALMEIKNPKTQYGRAGLSKLQAEWHAEWRGGTLAVVCDVESALRVLKVMEA